MEKTDQALIERVKQADKYKKEILRKEEINKAYHDKLAQVMKEQKRHLKNAKNVPREFNHKYEMDKRSEDLLAEHEDETFKVTFPNYRALAEESDAELDIEEDDDEDYSENDDDKTSTVSQNYRETVELVKKYIRIDIPET